jgi:hypothetical protein
MGHHISLVFREMWDTTKHKLQLAPLQISRFEPRLALLVE